MHRHRKPALVVMCRAVEEAVLRQGSAPLIFVGFQHARYFRAAATRYAQMAEHAAFLALYGQEATHPTAAVRALGADDPLAREWFVIVDSPTLKTLLVYRETDVAPGKAEDVREFDGVWTFEPQVVEAASMLLVAQGFDAPTNALQACTEVHAIEFDSHAHHVAQQQIEGAVMGALEESRSDASYLRAEMRSLSDEVSRSQHLLTTLFMEKAQADMSLTQAAAAANTVTNLVERLAAQLSDDDVAALSQQVAHLHHVLQPAPSVMGRVIEK